MASDEWRVVTRRGKGRVQQMVRQQQPTTAGFYGAERRAPAPADPSSTLSPISSWNKLKNSSYGAKLIDASRQALAEVVAEELVCYGVGNFTTSLASSYQLAYLGHLCALLRPKRALLFEPLLTSSECELAITLDREAFCVELPLGSSATAAAAGNVRFLTLLESNEEAARTVTVPTVFYMPHCTKQLYHNLLLSNWSAAALPLLIIVGNSFQSYDERMIEDKTRDEYKLILAVRQYAVEVPLPGEFDESPSAFNDCSVHTFSAHRIAKAPDDFWRLSADCGLYSSGC